MNEFDPGDCLLHILVEHGDQSGKFSLRGLVVR